MEQLQQSCDKYAVYPRNLVGQKLSRQRIDAYLERLRSDERRLFAERPPKVTILDVRSSDEGSQRTIVSCLDDIKHILDTKSNQDARDRQCRFFFIHAAHSRSGLRISRDMLAYICSYYQVPPSFLDFIFPFGEKEHDKHNDVCALRNDSLLFGKQRGLEIPALGRSGRNIRISYHLQSVEQSSNQISLPWSIRQTAVYHSYDVETEQSIWINVKGNQELENKVDAEPMINNPSPAPNMSSFSATLTAHMVFAEWAGQNWRVYINELEKMVFDATERTIFAPVNHSQSTIHSHSRSSTIGSSEKSQSSSSPSKPAANAQPTGQEQRKPPPELPPGAEKAMTNTSFGSEESRFLDDFSFSDLQRVQSTEERIEDVIMVLSLNITTLSDLRHLYSSSVQSEEILLDFIDDVNIFDAQIVAIENDLARQVGRSKTLLQKIQERKALLNSILQYRSMKAGEFFASKAQQSSESMEKLTIQMHTIAVATKRETVSMHIITVVTLFFLPGTFVATFLSTDVLQWSDNHREFTPAALNIYLAITLPLTALTFVAWSFMSRNAERKDVARTKYSLFSAAA